MEWTKLKYLSIPQSERTGLTTIRFGPYIVETRETSGRVRGVRDLVTLLVTGIATFGLNPRRALFGAIY